MSEVVVVEQILIRKREPVGLVDLLAGDEGGDFDFEPERLGLTARSAEL